MTRSPGTPFGHSGNSAPRRFSNWRRLTVVPIRPSAARGLWTYWLNWEPGRSYRSVPTSAMERLDCEEPTCGDAMTAAEILDLEYDAPVEELKIGLRCLLNVP